MDTSGFRRWIEDRLRLTRSERRILFDSEMYLFGRVVRTPVDELDFSECSVEVDPEAFSYMCLDLLESRQRTLDGFAERGLPVPAWMFPPQDSGDAS